MSTHNRGQAVPPSNGSTPNSAKHHRSSAPDASRSPTEASGRHSGASGSPDGAPHNAPDRCRAIFHLDDLRADTAQGISEVALARLEPLVPFHTAGVAEIQDEENAAVVIAQAGLRAPRAASTPHYLSTDPLPVRARRGRRAVSRRDRLHTRSRTSRSNRRSGVVPRMGGALVPLGPATS